MTLLDIMAPEQWEALEQELHALSGMNTAVFDADGRRVTGFVNWANALCPAIKAHPGGLAAICACANQVVSAQAARTGAPVVEECDAGLAKIAAPVMVRGDCLGTVGCCGLRLDGVRPEVDYVARTLGRDPGEVARMAFSVGSVSRERAGELANFMAGRVREILRTLGGPALAEG